VTTQLAGPQAFDVAIEGAAGMSAADRTALVEFQQKAARLQRAAAGAVQAADALKGRLALVKRALRETPAADPSLATRANDLNRRIDEILRDLRGDQILAARNENVPLSIVDRVGSIVDGQRFSTSRPTKTQQDSYTIASDELTVALGKLHQLVDVDLASLEKAMEAAGAPWTPGRLPSWP